MNGPKWVTLCPTCKQEVKIASSDEGTHWYANLDGSEHVCGVDSKPSTINTGKSGKIKQHRESRYKRGKK
jgi:hypothetical protein